MKINIVGRKIKLTDPIKNFIEEKVTNVLGYIHNIVWVQVVVGVDKKQHFAEIVAHVGHQTLKATGISDDLYSAVDLVLDKIEKQAKKYKEKNEDMRKEAGEVDFTTPVIVSDIRFSVVKNVPVKPMTREEAVIEMEKLGFNFWLFVDKESKQTQVVFKRLDSTYGILMPVKK
ncbi:MAG TPA: ribosome-associated translation inhibitor RaiA [Elusimicrobiales bacterium]|nr:ribosome-associated translation inhibitor RaiA [Elusimicrobiales bacterium]HOL61740.1 ribosome-associated translation inhibitor RaiA [Elusimicrobiales bacterium]HPO94935.1 ribosome-associated translation inhibitor RaiA [Elusimicrobiales bacterium]